MTNLTAPAARALIGEWRLALTSERKSPATVALYLDAVGRYLAWAETRDLPPLRRTSLQTWITDMLHTGRSPSTARIRQQAVRRYAAWLLTVGHLDSAPFRGMTSPKLDQPVVDPLTVAEVRALLQTCRLDVDADHGEPLPLRHVRDEAIIRLMAETGIRLSEVIALNAGDLDLEAGLVTIRRGKGGRGRVIPVGSATTVAIRTYLAARQEQPHADREELWLGERRCGLAADALYRSLRRRAERAGITGFRPHRLRHTAAHRWLAAGGSESGLMAMAGWTRTDMLIRYTRAGASARAAEEARRLNLGAF
ncbi:tyrosine-type recombinase/integrase [Nocardioides dilutus]